VSLDIDGVLDRMAFGFPSTTAAGIQAISLLHAHGFTIALNTARSLREVVEYCRAYHFAGGVVEYGSAIYDAFSDRHLVLVSQQSLQELEQARHALRQIPGIFLNDDYQFSLRAFTYQQGRTSPLPPLMVQDLLAGLKLNSLRAHHTGLDTAIIAKEVDKGKGLISLLSYVGLPSVDVVAVGDSEPDLAMFAAASRCFAPGNVSCAREAQLLGCHISDASYQPGLLQIAHRIVHPEGGECDYCQTVSKGRRTPKGLFWELLAAADESPFRFMLQRLMDGSLLDVIRQ
jgi:hydroxymethylpyrimidine pyrophosphatase-like HAD family hydrolase